jgi:transcriptional regulator with XRE-family HTH domain
MKHVAKNIRLLRIKQNWNQEFVARQLNISIPAYSKIKTGATDINLSRLKELADVFKVGIMDILRLPNDSIDDVASRELERCKSMLLVKEQEISSLQKQLIELFCELRAK